MIRRLAAARLAVCLVVLLGACRPPPEKAPQPPPPPPAPKGAPAVAYKVAVSPTLQEVRKRGWLSCGVHPGLTGFAYKDARGDWRGFDVDICRAIAAATLGDAKAVRFTPLDTAERFSALQAGKIDVLARNTSWTYSRDAGLALDFPAVTYFDGQGFMAPRALGLTSVQELSGARICVQKGSTSEQNLADYFRVRALTYRPVMVEGEAAARLAYQDEQCDAYSTDVAALAAARSQLNNPNAHVILPDVISKETLGPVVRQEDPVWADIVRWTVYALVLGEEMKLHARDVDTARGLATDPEARRLLGLDGELGPLLGLRSDWAYQAIRQVGAYDEIFERNIGADSPLKLARGLNAQWSADPPGLLYAPPMR